MLWKNTYNEFIKILAKPRSYIGLAALTLLIVIILFAMKADGRMYISFVTASFEQTLSFNGNILNGNLIAFIVLQMLSVHIPFLCALNTVLHHHILHCPNSISRGFEFFLAQ